MSTGGSGARRGSRFPLSLDRVPRGAGGTSQVLVRPQRPLSDAAREGARATVSAGVGLDSTAVRDRMVQRLRESGIRDERVLAAFGAVSRHAFVDSALVNQAYEDTSLPIGWGQTISKPSVVARMLQLLCQRPGLAESAHAGRPLGRVLEIGTGCGYQAALLCLLGRSVISIERLRPLHDAARERLESLRGQSLRLVFGDGMLGHAPSAPYDTIVSAAGGEELPRVWTDQLADGGRLVAPQHDAATGGQRLVVIDRHGEQLHREVLDAVHFVPLKSGTQ